MASVQMQNIGKSFGDVIAVKEINLTINDGEFFSLLGPSGCGKTTLLRMIAGFYLPTTGHILFNDRDVSSLPPNKRNTAMVFQNYALFPHMTVFDNVAFGLQARKIAKQEIKERVMKSLELVDLSNLGSRHVTQLSGGQQQRVALARAIVIEPDILLLDEPLSNLDAKLRRETREEIFRLQRELKITTIYVTHDQEEALSLSDRIALLNKGECQQLGTPYEIYNQPANEFVAHFIGRANLLKGIIKQINENNLLVEINQEFMISVSKYDGFRNGQKVTLAIKPDAILVRKDQAVGKNIFIGKILTKHFNGYLTEYEIKLGNSIVNAIALSDEYGMFGEDEIINVEIAENKISIVGAEEEI
ncbi:TPA: ABC transporter ATP-binding protein [bacterium]|nr:ABC transporter ATP-binding protein [bacterium]